MDQAQGRKPTRSRTPPKLGGIVGPNAERESSGERLSALAPVYTKAVKRTPLHVDYADKAQTHSFSATEIQDAFHAQQESNRLHEKLFSCEDSEAIPILAIEASCAAQDAYDKLAVARQVYLDAATNRMVGKSSPLSNSSEGGSSTPLVRASPIVRLSEQSLDEPCSPGISRPSIHTFPPALATKDSSSSSQQKLTNEFANYTFSRASPRVTTEPTRVPSPSSPSFQRSTSPTVSSARDMPAPLERLRKFRERLKCMIDGKGLAGLENGTSKSVSPLSSTMPVSTSGMNANREGFNRLQNLSERVSTIKNALEDIVSGRAYINQNDDTYLAASQPISNLHTSETGRTFSPNLRAGSLAAEDLTG